MAKGKEPEINALELATDKLIRRKPYHDLAKKYGWSPAQLQRFLTSWLDRGRFELVDREDGWSEAARVVADSDDWLESRLATKLGIWRARVPHISGTEAATTDQYLEEPSTAESAHRAADLLHRALGEVAARLFLSVLQKRMSVGVASGRGAAYTVNALLDMARRDSPWVRGYENTQIYALCGGARVGSWALPDPRDLDADENAVFLGRALHVSEGSVRLMGELELRKGEEPPVFAAKLSLALIGIGALNTSHHLLRHRSRLRDLAEPLSRIADWQRREPDLRFAAADIGDRVFPLVERTDLPEDFVKAIDEVNGGLRAAPPDAIRYAEQVILVAGGAQKAQALARLLTGRVPEAPVERRNLILVTDAWTAEYLLSKA